MPDRDLTIINDQLSSLRLQHDVMIQLHSHSLLHLYFNSSLECYDPAATSQESQWTGYGVAEDSHKSRKKKPNIEGLVTKAPFFMQRVRASATLNPVQEH